MPFTDGEYTGLSNSFNNAANGTLIDPGDWNALFTDIETAINDLAEVPTLKYFGAVGDGVTDDTDAVQTAFSTGKGIWVPDGTYLVNETLTVGTSGLGLFGNPGKAIIKAGSSLADGTSLVQTSTLSGVLSTYENSNITFDGITFDGASRTLTSVIAMIRLFKVSGLSITRCTIKNHKYMMLALGGCERFNVSDNAFENWGKTAVSAEGGPAVWCAANPTDNTVSRDGRISFNRLKDSEWVGIYCFGDGVDIIGNKGRSLKEGLIYTRQNDSGTGNDFKRSNIMFNKWDTITVKNIAAAGIECAGSHFRVAYNGGTTTDGAGIVVTDPGVNVDVSHNDIINAVRDTTTFASYGQITVQITNATVLKPDNVRITNNRCEDTAGPKIAPAGISVRRVSGSDTIDNLFIKDNDLANSCATAGNEVTFSTTALLGTGYYFETYDSSGNLIFTTDRKISRQNTSGANLWQSTAAGLFAIGDITPAATNDIFGTVGWRAGTPTLSNGDNDDVSFANVVVRVTGPTGAFAVTSIATPTSGRLQVIYNPTGQTMTLKHQSGGTAANRIITHTGEDVVIPTGGGAFLRYSATDSRWVLVSLITMTPRLTSIELGHATDTTIARSAAGIISVEGVDQVNLSSVQTLTSKTLTDPTISGGGGSIDTGSVQTNSLRIDQATTGIGTGVKTISNAADSSTNFGKYISISANGTTIYIPCSTVAPT